ncbi:hypothetical protein GQ54DRAFT_162295 [Martensiomyces pterosporus]|nr:hypothetical protein GQ54DRAFT_162295 [Martensiomyces pterosporus]
MAPFGARKSRTNVTWLAFPPCFSRPSLSACYYTCEQLGKRPRPFDQWVAVSNGSSGVISLTSSDNEDERPDSALSVINDSRGASTHGNGGYHQMQGDGKEPAQQAGVGSGFAIGFSVPVDAQYRDTSERPPLSTRRGVILGAENEQDSVQAVHMLRESVASLLSSAGSSTSSASSANPGSSRRRHARQHQPLGQEQQGSSRHLRQRHDVSRSPSRLSKVSEPCYPSSAPRRRFTADLDHFSDIALSTNVATPPHQAPSSSRLPTYEEYKLQQQQQQQAESSATLPPSSDQGALRRRTNTNEGSDADAIVPRAYEYADVPSSLLADHQAHHMPAIASVSSIATRSPFASIQTISPVIVPYKDCLESPMPDTAMISRVQAEAVLEQTILCPMGSSSTDAEKMRLVSSSGKEGATNAGNGYNSPGGYPSSGGSNVQAWAKYTGYAIIGFGVGTLVGMMCFDLAATATPKATRTIPVTGI